MAVENATFISELQVSNPTAGDPVGEGYEHINVTKGVLVNTFPNLSGQVTATPGHLNNPLLATDRPPAAAAGQVQVQTVPYYSSASGASTFPITDFGKSLMAMANSAALSSSLKLEGFVLKAGDTMTGTLKAPRIEVGSTIKVYENASGEATIELGASRFVFRASNLEIFIGDKLVVRVAADGTFRAAENVQGGAF